jgi:hypothetical protein
VENEDGYDPHTCERDGIRWRIPDTQPTDNYQGRVPQLRSGIGEAPSGGGLPRRWQGLLTGADADRVLSALEDFTGHSH